MSPSLQVQARALGDPTRHRIFEYLVDAGAPTGVAELTDHFGLNHNAVRQHLAKLVDAQLVVEATAAPSGRGRPRLEFSIDPSAESRWGVTGPYEQLSVLLTEIVRTGDEPVEVGRRAARRRRLGAASDSDPLDVLVDEMTRQGFSPVVRHRGNSTEVVLQDCPFSSAVLTDPETICQLHLGMARGVAETVEGLTVDELIPKDPRRANCRLRCHVSHS
ncbi:MAG: helix-turn-helix transcriptional regulator [Microthrixaceae bacterium]